VWSRAAAALDGVLRFRVSAGGVARTAAGGVAGERDFIWYKAFNF
jgi:hypothetical protein